MDPSQAKSTEVRVSHWRSYDPESFNDLSNKLLVIYLVRYQYVTNRSNVSESHQM